MLTKTRYSDVSFRQVLVFLHNKVSKKITNVASYLMHILRFQYKDIWQSAVLLAFRAGDRN